MIEMLTGRPPTLAPRGMVACPHALASEAGVEILKAGGSAAEKGVSLSPNSAGAYFALGAALANVGRHQEAIPMLQKSLRLSPIPVHSQVLGILASSYAWLGQYEEAVATFKKVLKLYGPDHLQAHLGLAITYAFMDREKEARSEG